MKKLLISAVIIAAATLTGCNANQAKPTSYADIVAQAKTIHADAANSGYSWKQKKMKKSYVDYYLALAADAKASGDSAGALKAANAALNTANAEVAQRDDAKSLKAGWEK
ncbi:MAG: hypothetical protein ISEC1_P0010 [Thiomicrorhabdus sp.]|nr:MAG: hypothetical protein ISEC1_P0010 [Thiomicrorhabdus sp.]